MFGEEPVEYLPGWQGKFPEWSMPPVGTVLQSIWHGQPTPNLFVVTRRGIQKVYPDGTTPEGPTGTGGDWKVLVPGKGRALPPSTLMALADRLTRGSKVSTLEQAWGLTIREAAYINPRSVNDWELYQMPGSEEAAKQMTAALDAALRELHRKLSLEFRGADPAWNHKDEARLGEYLASLFNRVMRPVMRKFSQFGAEDTEPREVAKFALVYAAKEFFGVRRGVSWGDWI